MTKRPDGHGLCKQRTIPTISTFVLWLAITPLSSTAQTTSRVGTAIRAEHVAASAAGAIVLSLIDKPVQDLTQRYKTPFTDHLADAFRQLGEADVVLPGALGIIAAGLVFGDETLERTGSQVAVSMAVAAIVTGAGKFIIGRERPGDPDDSSPWRFDPLTGLFEKAFPSGHSALAFALMTTLADATSSRPVRSVLYAAAAGTAWSRLYNNRHWLSDVGFGAIVGITASRLTTGRWTLFGIESPSYLSTPNEGSPGFAEVALSAAAGIGIFQLARFTQSTMSQYTPFVTPLDGGSWALGATIRY